jgi:hypothetical protein
VLGETMGKTWGVNLPREPVLIEVVAPSTSAASQACGFTSRLSPASYYGRQTPEEQIDTALRKDPNNGRTPGYYVSLVAPKLTSSWVAGLRFLLEGVGEAKRLFVAPTAKAR